MNIGDRVRLIHSKEEGVVTKIFKNNVVEVEIEDGFKLPILKRELAIISQAENNYFKQSSNIVSESPQKAKSSSILADKGIFLAFLPKNENILSLFVINNTDFYLPFSLTTIINQTSKGICGGYLLPKSFHKSSIDFQISDFENWGVFRLDCLYFLEGTFATRQSLSKSIRFRANSFFNFKKNAPLLEKDAYLIQLDSDINFAINVSEIKEKMFDSVSETTLSISKPSDKIDLHIENLIKNANNLSNSEILALQLKEFEQKLEQGIASGLDEMTFIHGVGNGILKNEIQKRLTIHKNVAWFQDAQKEKFGYGATRIKFK